MSLYDSGYVPDARSFGHRRHRGPAGLVPRDLADGELRPAAILRVIGVEDQVVLAVERIDAVVPDTGPAGISREQQGAAALVHALAVTIEVRTADVLRSPDDHLVGAVNAAAAVVPGNEQMIVGALAKDERRLDRGGLRVRIIHEDRALALGKRMPFLGLGDASQRRGELHELEAAPEGAERHPGRAALVEHELWIDRVPEVAIDDGLHHHAAVRPLESGRGAIERLVGGDADGGGDLSSGRDRVIEV